LNAISNSLKEFRGDSLNVFLVITSTAIIIIIIIIIQGRYL